MKIIKYYIKNSYGNHREFVADESSAKILMGLLGQKTINAEIRQMIEALTDGQVKFEKVPQPENQ